MSISIKTSFLTNEIKQQIHNDLTIEMIDNFTMQEKDNLYTYTITGKENDEIIYVPYAYGRLNGYKNVKKYPKVNFSYKKEYPLREKQIQVKKEAISILNKNGSIILALYTGFGKTALSLYLASIIGLKTVYINNNLAIINQIAESVKKFTNGKCQILTPKTVIDPDCDIYIINAINVPKFPEGSFDHIGLVIIDEVHCILSKVFSKCLFCFTPKYFIGLSATPYREDSMDILFNLYFGQENKIEIKLDRLHIVYKINTPIKPFTSRGFGGRLDWNGVLKSLAENKIRNDKIVEIIENMANNSKPHLNIGNGTLLVIFKFVEQIKIIEEKLKEKNIHVDSLYGTKKKFDVNAKVLLGTLKKVGVGFDHPRINSLFPVCDIQAYYKQVQGRCMRTPDVQPIFIEMVDNFHVLYKHWGTRKQVYEEHGGVIKNMDWDTLEILDGNSVGNPSGGGAAKNNRAIVQLFTFPKE